GGLAADVGHRGLLDRGVGRGVGAFAVLRGGRVALRGLGAGVCGGDERPYVVARYDREDDGRDGEEGGEEEGSAHGGRLRAAGLRFQARASAGVPCTAVGFV